MAAIGRWPLIGGGCYQRFDRIYFMNSCRSDLDMALTFGQIIFLVIRSIFSIATILESKINYDLPL